MATIRPGHNWGGDFSMYITHARNLAEGRPYAQSGYIYNRADPALGPRTYPPGFPLMLAPVYRAFGMNLQTMKVLVIVAFAAGLAAAARLFAPGLSAGALAGAVLVAGAHPYFWEFKDNVLSDLPFLLWVYAALLATSGRTGAGGPPWRSALRAAGGGAAMYLACATRSVGVVLPAAVVAAALLRRDGRVRLALAAAGLCAAGVAVQTWLLGAGGEYLHQLSSITPAGVFANIRDLRESLFALWDAPLGPAFKACLLWVMLAAAGAGFVRRCVRGVTCVEVFCVLYLAVIIVWPADQWQRFLIPLLPLGTMYCFVGLGVLGRRLPGRAGRATWLAVALAAGLSYLAVYLEKDFGPMVEGVAKAESVELFEFVRERTGESSVLLFAKPRVLGLYTGRRSARPRPGWSDEQLWEYVDRIGATHAIADAGHLPAKPTGLDRLAAAYPARFSEVFANADFRVYRIRGAPVRPAARP